jgi:arsenite methyltransferase
VTRRTGRYGVDGSFEVASLPWQVAFWAAVMTGLASLTVRGALRRRPLEAIPPGLVLAALGGTIALFLQATLAGKFAVWERLLDELRLGGGERILDLGCGRGAVLVAAARRLRGGHATGVDLWHADQSGNSPAATLANAELGGVAPAISLLTADVTRLPFPDAGFDLVLSSLALHDLDGEGRRAAIAEAVRVLREGGRMVLVDLGFTRTFARRLRESGMTDVRRRNAGWRMWYGGPYFPAHIVTARRPSRHAGS